MSESCRIQLPGFEGSVEDMVEAVQAGRLALTGVRLSDAAGQVLAYLETQRDVDLNEAGESARSIARLTAQKAAILTAQPADEIPERPVARPRGDWTSASSGLRDLEGLESFPAGPREMPRPVEPRKPRILLDAWSAMAARAASVEARVEVRRFLRLEFALSRVLRWVSDGKRAILSQVLRGATRDDAVMHFLAVLELARRDQITVQQLGLFDEIEIARAGEDRRGKRRRAG